MPSLREMERIFQKRLTLTGGGKEAFFDDTKKVLSRSEDPSRNKSIHPGVINEK